MEQRRSRAIRLYVRPAIREGFGAGIGVLQKPGCILKFAVVAPAFTSGHGSERAQIAVANGRSKWQSAGLARRVRPCQ